MKVQLPKADPWGWAVAAASGCGGFVVVLGPAGAGTALVVGVGIAGAVLASKEATDELARYRRKVRRRSKTSRLPQPRSGSSAAKLLSKADAAISQIARLCRIPEDPWIRHEVLRVQSEALGVRHLLSEIAGHLALAEESLTNADAAAIDAELVRLTELASSATDPRVLSETKSALASAQQQSEVVQRVRHLRDALLRRVEASVSGLEAVAVGVAEIVASGGALLGDDPEGGRIRELNDALEALRFGLTEAQLMR